jgi:exonuclease VII small subunit
MKKEQTYEQALKEIDEVVKRLETGNLPLEESPACYDERGRVPYQILCRASGPGGAEKSVY